MIKGKTLTELAQELERRNNAMQDFIVPTSKLHMEAWDDKPPQMIVDGQGGYLVNQTGHDTLAQRLNIPTRYYSRMLDTAPALLSYNVNEWLKQEAKDGTNRMVRTLDGKCRAFLSDRYERYDNFEFAMTTLPVLMDSAKESGHEIEVVSSEITDRKLYIQLTFKGLEKEIPIRRADRVVGEVVRAGLILKNSEVGYGSREIQFLAYTLACTNGMVVPREIGTFSTRHLGRRKGNGLEILELSQEAQDADRKAFALATRDAVKQMVSMKNLDALTERMQAANKRPIEGAPDEVVKALGKSFQLSEGEQTSIMQHFFNAADASHYGLVNAVTRSAQDSKSYDRAVELEHIGGVLLHMPERELVPILNATAKAA